MIVTAASVPCETCEPRYRFDVLSNDFGHRVDDSLKRRHVALKIRDQRLDDELRAPRFGFGDRLGKYTCTAVVEIVPVHRCDNNVPEVHTTQRLGHASGLRPIYGGTGLAGFDTTETAPTCANVAKNHDGRGPISPAFTQVRAEGLLAHGVKLELTKILPQTLVGRPGRQADLEPGWFAFDGGITINHWGER